MEERKQLEQLQRLSQAIRKPGGILLFAEKILGLPVTKHEGQLMWLKNSNRVINILRPGNRFGKSFIGAVKHLYHGFTKINIEGMYETVDDWQKIKYDTLNFGPGYEQAREVLRLAKDIAQGAIHIPVEYQKEYGVTNQSLLKDWFIIEDRTEAASLPYLLFSSGTYLYGRSYDEMGSAFKMKGLAYISGDEVGDITELWTFTNGTLLPRLAQYKNPSIDYYGTPQPEGIDYMKMIDMAEEDMAKPDWEKNGMFYTQRGSMYQNPFLDKKTVQQIETTADANIRRQIIYGEYVDTGDKYFGYERIQNAIDKELTRVEKGLPNRKYVLSVDFAGGESAWADFTVMMVIDYTEEPYRLVHFKRFKGGAIPIPMQYKMVEDLYDDFGGYTNCRVIIDSSALGGKNALAFLKRIKPITFDMTPKLKSEMLGTVKIAFDGGQSKEYKRETHIERDGTVVDDRQVWGLIKLPDIPVIITELANYKLEDKKIRTDCVMTLGMAIHWIEMRRPRHPKNFMVGFDLLGI